VDGGLGAGVGVDVGALSEPPPQAAISTTAEAVNSGSNRRLIAELLCAKVNVATSSARFRTLPNAVR